MDMQGQPIGGSNASTTVSTDPKSYQNATKEGAGAVASDSLAAESARSGGTFGDNRDSNPQSVSGSKSTFANTDTSGASTLPPAPDAQARDNVWNESGAGQKYPEGAGGQGSFPGSHAGGTYSGGSSAAKAEFGSGTQGDSSTTSKSGGAFSDSGAGGPSADQISSSGGQQSQKQQNQQQQQTQRDFSSGDVSGSGSASGSGDVPSAPGYVSSVTQPLGQNKPKGSNITEGSEEEFNQARSVQAPEIGSEDDPARRAEADFQRMTQQASGSTAPRQGGQKGDTTYSSLQNDQQL